MCHLQAEIPAEIHLVAGMDNANCKNGRLASFHFSVTSDLCYTYYYPVLILWEGGVFSTDNVFKHYLSIF